MTIKSNTKRKIGKVARAASKLTYENMGLETARNELGTYEEFLQMLRDFSKRTVEIDNLYNSIKDALYGLTETIDTNNIRGAIFATAIDDIVSNIDKQVLSSLAFGLSDIEDKYLGDKEIAERRVRNLEKTIEDLENK